MEQPHENAPRLTPNHFELKHAHTTITYDTAAFDGKPRLSYHAPHYHTAQTFSGDQIRTQPHAIGSLITVTLQVIPDLEERLLTLLLPAIQLVGTDEEPFQAVGILTTQRDSIAGPGPGPAQIYQVLHLEGVARFVDA